METKLKSIANKIDAYSDMQIPFAVGSWCRQNKFNTVAVDILRSVKEREALSAQIATLERERDRVEYKIEALCQTVMHDKLGVAHGV